MEEREPRFVKKQQHTSCIILNPQCSCPRCDSMQCFSKRQGNEPCSCQKCENSKTCLNFPYKLDKDGALNNNMRTPMEGDDITTKERVKREITYELIVKSHSVTKNMKKALVFDDNRGEKPKIDTSGHPSIQINNNAGINVPRKGDSSAAKLSAQIMDIPYQNLDEDIPDKPSDSSSYKISAYDVLKRIRDAYKACSCKVCDCLVGKPLEPTNTLCKCEPCDCKDCMSFLTKFQYLGRLEKQMPEGCPCIRCTNSQCKALNKKSHDPKICDCPPCNCIKCAKSFSKPCNCEPCQCLECKAVSFRVPKSIIVAPVGEQHLHNYCQCTPCECIECGGYGIPSSFMRETATDVNRHPRCQCEVCTDDACIPDGSESCKCERRNKVMTKPVQKDVRDYDIRAMVTSEKVLRLNNKKPLRNSMIALYATVPNVYENFRHRKECSCNLCECVVCNCKENAVDSIKSSQLFENILKEHSVPNLDSGACKCSPCECQICSKKEDGVNTMTKGCKCDTCSCLNCEGLKKGDSIEFCPYVNAIKDQSIREVCKCGPCECVDCNKAITCAGDVCSCAIYGCGQCLQESKESIYPIKRAEVLTPSSFKNEFLMEANNPKPNIVSVKNDCEGASGIKLYDSHGKTTFQIDAERANPQNYRLVENMKYILPPGKKSLLHPKSDKNESKSKVHSSQNRSNTLKYVTQSHSSNICEHSCENNYIQSKSNISIGSLSVNITGNSEHGRITRTFTEGELCANSCDSGCGSLDYYTIIPELATDTSKTNEQRYQDLILKYQLSQNKNDFQVQQLSKDPVMENQGHHHHSFESDNNNYFARHNIANDYSTSHSEKSNDKIAEKKQMYDQQYWIKNVGLSVKLHEPNVYKCEENYSVDLSRNNLTHHVALKDVVPDNGISIPISRNIGDYALNSHGEQVKELLNNEEYYEGVQKTLHRARAFSLQLMKVLDKYERANNEFQSITQKLKLSHASLLNDKVLQEPNTNLNDSSLSTRSSEQDCDPEKFIYFTPNQNEQETSVPSSLFNVLQTKGTNERYTQVESLPTNFFCYPNTSVLDNMEKCRNTAHYCNITKKKEGKNALKELSPLSERKLRGIKNSTKYSSRIFKQLIRESNGVHSTSVSIHDLKIDASTQIEIFFQKYEQPTTTTYTNISSNNLTEETKTADLEPVLPILKKNYYLLTKPVMKNKGVCMFPSLQREVKQATRTMSMQTKTTNNEYPPHKNMALENLQSEVRKLLEMPMLEHSESFKSEPQSSRSCCDAFKVNFLSLRRVSDHTVLVKWTAPRLTQNVKGYELLLDGRAVQKIMSPSRCVAVVTCLPHCDTILLTIRTITPLTPSGHYPSSTVVYHPRARRE